MREREIDPLELIRTSPLFDGDWYVARYADVASFAGGPARHYLDHGGFDGRDPGPEFNSAYYLRAYPDVRRAGMNPLLHYTIHGVDEGRSYRNDYARWVAECERLDDVDRAAIRHHIAELAEHPLLSVVVPVYDPKLDHLCAMIASVKRQAYPYWELCIADDASTDPDIVRTLREAAAGDRRIKVAVRDRNGHICAATNTAMGLATGAFLCLLDHDDLLHENALYEIAAELNAHPDADLIFSDSDQIDDAGIRYNPYFKSDWNYDLMLGQNLVSHLGAYRRTVVERVGGMRPGYEGSQDYDLALRVADATQPSQIRHIPAVLYHWRRPFETESFSDAAHERCVAVARTATADHLARRSIDARVEPAPKSPNFSRVVYAVPSPPPAVTVALFATGAGDELVDRIGTVLFQTDYDALELLVVWCGPVPENVEAILARAGHDRRVRVLRIPAAAGAAAKNRAVREAHGEVVVLLDVDLRPADPQWLRALVSHVLRPDAGLVGGVVVDADGKVADRGIVLNASAGNHPMPTRSRGSFSIFALTREVSALPSSCLAARRRVYLDAGGLDEDRPLRDAEIALALRVRAAGRRNIVTPDAELERAVTGPRGAESAASGEPVGVAEDPFYNPNLALDALFDQPDTRPRRVKPWAASRRRLWTRESQAQRARLLLAGVERSARILEIGPSYSPIAPRADGWRTLTIDHASRAQLVEKYAAERDVWVDRIEDVDFVWSGGSLADAVPAALHGTFDVAIASHVIEHAPDLVAFLRAIESLLDAAGTLILAIPDKRFCFDYFRPLASTAHVLEAHDAARTRHARRTVFEHNAYAVTNDGEGAWGDGPVGALAFAHSFDDAMATVAAFDPDSGAEYVDMHAWQFTPSSFALIVLELARLGRADWSVETITEATGCEFRTRLRRGGTAAAQAMAAREFDAARLALMQSIVAELSSLRPGAPQLTA